VPIAAFQSEKKTTLADDMEDRKEPLGVHRAVAKKEAASNNRV
jgi:hypothetical protein